MTRDTPGNVELQNDVAAALERSDGLDSALSVSAHEGVVTLAGSVDDEIDVVAAQDIAEGVPGVTGVAVEIALRHQRAEGSQAGAVDPDEVSG
jgi:osmotically-inducible protein OsmY